MTRQVSAEVVLAALRNLDAGLSERPGAGRPDAAVRASSARLGVRRLIEQVEQQAAELPTELEDPTQVPREGYRINDAGEFAAAWNACDKAHRAQWFANWAETADRATACIIQNHESYKLWCEHLLDDLTAARLRLVGAAWELRQLEQRRGWVIEP